MSHFRVKGLTPLRGTLRLPADLRIAQQAILWAALSKGPCLIAGQLERKDHELLVNALRELGVPIAETEQGLRIQGVGLRGLSAPRGALKAGDSLSTLELLAMLLVGQRFGTRVEAYGAAAQRSLRSWVEPLRARGAAINGKRDDEGHVRAPIAVAPLFENEPLSEVEIEIPDGDAATKLALLLSGLHMRGVTAIGEGTLSPDHAERALVSLGVPVETLGSMTVLDTLEWDAGWDGFEWRIPADLTLASYVIAAASVIPGSDVTLPGVGVNRTRTAFFDVLRHMGARVDVVPKGDAAGNEPVADVRVRSASLRGAKVSGELSQRLVEELPALGLLALAAGSRTGLRDASSVRLHKPDVLKALSQSLRAVGVECTDYEDGFDIDPMRRAQGNVLEAERMAGAELFGLFLALCAQGESQVGAAPEILRVFPGVDGALRSLGAEIEIKE